MSYVTFLRLASMLSAFSMHYCAILRIYDKLLITMIMTSNMLCKVRVKVGL